MNLFKKCSALSLIVLTLTISALAVWKVDPNFPASLTSSGPVFCFDICVQPDNKIVVGGQFRQANGVNRGNIARFNADGTLDLTFTPVGYPDTNAVLALDLQTDGKILVAGIISGAGERLNPNGSHEVTFGFEQARDIRYLPDGKILMAWGPILGRFISNGSSDNSFPFVFTSNGGSPPAIIYKMAVQPDGKIIIVGNFTLALNQNRVRIARINTDGSLDGSFNPPGGASDNIYTVALQADGKILIGGEFTSVNFDTNKKYLARLNPDSSLDSSFAPVLNAPVFALKVQPDGKILVGGSMSHVNGVLRPGIARLNQDGTLDTSFDIGTGTNSTVWSIDQQSNGKIIYGGQFTMTNGFPTPGIGRLTNSSAVFDYDGDGKADVSVYRPSTNRWYVFKSSDSTVSETTFGIAGDVPVPSDYDGDGKTDIAIFRPSSGDWWSLSSINGAQIFAHWGASGDIPRPSDFDGDGRADYVVFRPSDNFWYRISSGNGASSNGAFGLAGDKPVTGDFDGDGKSDKAIYRPSTGDWWYQSSLNGAQLATHWGISTDIPAPADYDGDGKTDFAVYRPSTGVWYIINSSNFSFLIMNFGIAEDKPVPADYDGDGKADIAVFRPSTGTWYQMKTTAGFAAQQFGISTDIPTENAFVP